MVAITTLTGREFNQDTARAKRAAGTGPVFITDRGRPRHVLLSIEDYERLSGRRMSAAEAFAQGEGEGEAIDFAPEAISLAPRVPDLSDD